MTAPQCVPVGGHKGDRLRPEETVVEQAGTPGTGVEVPSHGEVAMPRMVRGVQSHERVECGQEILVSCRDVCSA